MRWQYRFVGGGAQRLGFWSEGCCKKEKRGRTASEAKGLLRLRKADLCVYMSNGNDAPHARSLFRLDCIVHVLLHRLLRDRYTSRLLFDVFVLGSKPHAECLANILTFPSSMQMKRLLGFSSPDFLVCLWLGFEPLFTWPQPGMISRYHASSQGSTYHHTNNASTAVGAMTKPATSPCVKPCWSLPALTQGRDGLLFIRRLTCGNGPLRCTRRSRRCRRPHCLSLHLRYA